MLITEKIEAKVTSKNIDKIKTEIPNVSIGDIVFVSPSLMRGSRTKLEVQCDYCNGIVYVLPANYFKTVEDYNKYACKNTICVNSRRKEKIDTIYGGVDPSTEKRKKTVLEKYGTEYICQSEHFKNKAKDTLLSKYGVDNISKLNSVKEIKRTKSLEKYGTESTSQSPIVKEKKKKNTKLKYGVDHTSKLESTINKIRSTNIERYGVDFFFKTEEFKEKLNSRMLSKYGNVNFKSSEIYRKENYALAQHSNYIKYIGDKISLFSCDNGKNHTFEIDSANFNRRFKDRVTICTICNEIGDNSSIKQTDLYEYISSISEIELVLGYRDGLEIDIFIPKLNIGIEFNGLYWHSEKFKDKYYHKNKTDFFSKKGIRIIHIWEDDWNFKRDIVKSQIRNFLGLSNKIYARKTEVKKINKKLAFEFLDENHLQGSYSRIEESYGLFYKGELVSVMTFDTQEGRKSMPLGEYNLSRFCNKIGYSIIGGASKLLKQFLKDNKPNRIVSYADADWSNGNLYDVLGFEKVNQSRPDYKYIVNSRREHKSKFRKPKDSKKTESQIMSELGILKIYDSGKIKYELNTNTK